VRQENKVLRLRQLNAALAARVAGQAAVLERRAQRHGLDAAGSGGQRA
jgi:hypothetical protein